VQHRRGATWPRHRLHDVDLQCVWTLFTRPPGVELGGFAAALQVTFSLLIVLQTFFSPFQADGCQWRSWR
jgi:hypothetical protein